MQWLSGLYYADFISFYSPTQLCGGGTTKSNSNELPISVPLSLNYDMLTKPYSRNPWFFVLGFVQRLALEFHLRQQHRQP